MIPRLIETIGSLIKLLVILDRRDDLPIFTQEYYYPVRTDLTSCEILDRCLQVLSDIVLEVKPMIDVKHYQSIMNRLFTAATTVSRNDFKTDFSVDDLFEQQIARPSPLFDHQYDADDSASSSTDRSSDRRKNIKSSSQSTIIVSEKIIVHIVDILIGLARKEPYDNFCRVIEYGMAKLATLGRNDENRKRLVEMNLCVKLLNGLGNKLLKISCGTIVETFLELITILASHKMSRDEFRSMIGFFKCSPTLPKENVALVLKNFHRIVSETSCPATEEPSVFLTFQTGPCLMKKMKQLKWH